MFKFKKGKEPDNLMWKCDVEEMAWNNLKQWNDIVAINVDWLPLCD